MRVYVNDTPLDLLPWMTVRHALMASGLLDSSMLLIVRDQQGNEVGLDGALTEGMRLYSELRETS